ncbi:MAG: hypothetical protein ACT4NL_06160 [Pseudomarimonas sp.]
MPRPLRSILCSLLLILVACANTPDARQQAEALYLYAGAIRWGDIDGALTFIDPKTLEKAPLNAVDRARYDQVQFAGYTVKSSGPVGEDELAQIVEIRVVNRHTQIERTIIDRQLWRWDEASESWLLTTGLPKISGG